MSIHVRLRQLILSENISVTNFEEEIGVGKNTIATILRKQSAISHIILEKIKLRYSDYSLCWLVAGKTENDEMIESPAITSTPTYTNKVSIPSHKCGY